MTRFCRNTDFIKLIGSIFRGSIPLTSTFNYFLKSRLNTEKPVFKRFFAFFIALIICNNFRDLQHFLIF